MVATPTDTAVIRALRQYLWREPSAAAPQGSALARVRRGQVQVALVGAALWLGGLLGGILAEGGVVLWCLGVVAVAGVVTVVLLPRESALLTATLIVTAVVVLYTTRAQETGSPLAAGWFDAAAVSLIGLATLRRALLWGAAIGIASLTSWGLVVATTTIPGGWRSAVAWSVASVSLGVTSAVMAAVIRAGARRLDGMVASAQQAFTDEELQQAEGAEYESAARMLHDTVINTLTAIGRGVPEPDLPTLRMRCRQDLDLIDDTLPDGLADDTVVAVRSRAEALGLDLVVSGPTEALRQLPRSAREAISGAVGEALLNVAKHAGVRQVELRVAPPRNPGGEVVVELVDRGPGWSGLTASGGGIEESILARCRAAGVRAEVVSGADHGTTVTLSAPAQHADADGDDVFLDESRIMTALVCAVLLVDMGIRTVLGEGIDPSWGSPIAFGLLVMAMVWPWFNRRTWLAPGPLAPLGLALVGLPVVLLLPIEDGAVSWIWWGSISAIAIFLALVAMNASGWWVLLAYVLQMGGRYVAGDYTFRLLIPDALAVGLGAVVALWIRSRVLRLMSDTASVARERDKVRAGLLRREAGQRESMRRLSRATGIARRPLEAIAAGERTGSETDVQVQAAALAPYLRNVSRMGPGLGVLGAGMMRLLDSGWERGATVTMNVDPSVAPPSAPADLALAELVSDTADRQRTGDTCTVTLLSRPGGALLTIVTSTGAPSPGAVADARRAGLTVQTDAGDGTRWTEVSWDDRRSGEFADEGVRSGNMVA